MSPAPAERRTVLVTGAAHGIGRTLALAFLADGFTVIAGDVDHLGLHELGVAAGVGAPLHCSEMDITDERSVERSFAVIEQVGGSPLAVVVHAAGLIWDERTSVADMSLEVWERSLRVNATGTFIVAREAVRRMKAVGAGSIILISSAMTFSGGAGRAHYVASKAAVQGFTRALAREVGDIGITVNTVAPGLVDSGPRAKAFVPDHVWKQEEAQRAIPGRLHPADLIGMVRFLASDGSRAMTGQTLVVDGGAVMK